MSNAIKPKAVIYCRVSSQSQFEKGDGLESQATRCREFARYKGLEVIKTFQDTKSGSLIDRPGMQAMLTYLRKNRKEGLTVIIDDLSRMARGVIAHWELRTAITSAGAELASPSIEFGEDPDSILVENLLASVNQHQREKNAEQTVNRMRARMMNGYWVHPIPPIGYRYEKTRDRGKVLVRDEPYASIVQEGLEGYAAGRFQLQAEVKRFFESFPEFPRDAKGTVRNQKVHDILTHVVYSGYVESANWDISLRPGQHEGLISLETWQTIQRLLKEKAYAPTRKNLNEDFPLRGFVACGECGHPMTASWSKGRSARHPYYMCFKKGCSSYRKSIRRETLEGEFEALLKRMTPTEGLFNLARAIFEDLWNHRLTSQKNRRKALETELLKIDRKKDQLLDRLVDADSLAVISAYAGRIGKLEQDRMILQEKIAACGRAPKGFDESFRTAMEFLGNPWKLWSSEALEHKRAVLRLTFADRLSYVRNEGFRTAETTMPFKVLSGFLGGENKMAEREGFEPPIPSMISVPYKGFVSKSRLTGRDIRTWVEIIDHQKQRAADWR